MSYDDKDFMARGFRVRHEYGRTRSGRHGVCKRCGVKRRRTSSGWEYQKSTRGSLIEREPYPWTASNPPCVKKSEKQPRFAHSSEVHSPTEFAGHTIPPGTLVRLHAKLPGARDEGDLNHGTLWVWSRGDIDHYLVQATHEPHVHRVQAAFWHAHIASLAMRVIEGGDGTATGTISTAVYTMLREAGIAPVPRWRGESVMRRA